MSDAVESETAPRHRRFRLSERQAKFVREVGSVVLGVLIALALGAVATEIGWWFEVRNARHAIEVELGELIGQAEKRVMVAPCVERGLDRIAAIVDAAEKTGRLPPQAAIAIPPWRTWPRGIWGSTVTAQTASHLDRDLLDNYSSAYEFADLISAYSQRELDAWTRLSGIVGPGRSFGAQEALQLRTAIAEARLDHRMIALAGLRMKQIAVAYDLGYDANSAGEYTGRPPGSYAICAPNPAAPPAHYGQAPFENIIERTIAAPIIRRDDGGSTR